MKLLYPIQLLFVVCLILSGFWYIGSAITGLLLIVAAIFGSNLIFSRQTLQVYSLSKLMLAYLVWLFIVAYTSTVPNTSMMTLAVLAGLPVMYLVASNMPNFADIWQNLRVLLFITAVGLALWAIWQVENYIGYGYATGPLIDRNAFAALMNLLWFPAVFLFISSQSASKLWLKLTLGGGLFIISMALFATTSRGGILSWLLLLPFMLWAVYRRTKSKQIIIAVIVIVTSAYICCAQFLHSDIADRTFQIGAPVQIGSGSDVGQLSKDASVNARLLMWQSTLKIALDHPLMGTGWGTFAGYYPAYRSPYETTTSGSAAHNDYLQLAAEGGFIALLLLMGMVTGILLQLQKNMKHTADEANLEASALLLGVLAIFLHAAVNFIFVFAFMNILAGLYLARAAQLIDTTQTLKLGAFAQIRPSVKRLLSGFIVLLLSAPFAFHLISQACLTGSQPGLKTINLIAPKVKAYNIASFISAIYPKEYIAQEAVLQTAEQFLVENTNNGDAAKDFKQQLIRETIDRFDAVRARSANNPNIGVREAKMLVTYHELLGGDVAYAKAQQILNDNLKTDPYHVKSMIMYSRLQVAQGKKVEAIKTLQIAQNHIITRRDQQLLVVETLRQMAAPKVIGELDDIEKQLGLVRSDSETGKPLILPPNFSEDIDTRLNAIATQVQQLQ